MAVLRAARLVAVNDLRRRFRNRSFVIQAILGPLVLALLISAAFAGGFGFDVTIGIVRLDRSQLAATVEERLLEGGAGGVAFVAVEDTGTATRMVADDDDIGAAIVIPEGFAASLGQTDPEPLGVIVDEEQVVSAAVARAVARGVAARVDAGRFTVAAALSAGADAPTAGNLADIELPVTVERRQAGDELSPASTIAPGMGLLFLFFTVAAVARALLDERRQRVLDRMLSAPVSLSSVLLGKVMAVIVLGVVSLSTLWGATTVLFDAEWGDPAGVAVVLLAATLAVAGISAIVAAVAPNEQSADLLATAVAFTLGILGGSLVPLSELPEGLVRASLFTPNGWAQRAFAELSAGGGDLADVLPEAGVLLAWAAVTLAIGAMLLPRRLASR